MSFLQPLLLAALPLAGLPILIHLINQYRYQSVRWGAMLFLLAAQRMSRGYTKLRQWLILLFRVLAIATLIFAISRPLSSGWLGLAAGGRADTTLVLLDRSPSMQQQAVASGISKLDTARRQLSDTLRTLGASRWVLIESSQSQPRELADPDELLTLPQTTGISAESDIPALLETARQYLEANQVGQTEIWIGSDLRENDWQPSSGRWESLRDSFRLLGSRVRFHLLVYSQPASDNLALRVTQVRRVTLNEEAELLISLRLRRGPDRGQEDRNESLVPISVPIEFDIEGIRSVHTVELVGEQFDLQDHRIPLAPGQERGWGRVTIPADANPSDNVYYFAFGPPSPRRTLLVSEDSQSARPLQLAASIPSESALEYVVQEASPDELLTVPWEEVALLLWQGELPSGDVAELIEKFIARGGRAIFFPPSRDAGGDFLGVRWDEVPDSQEEIPVASWRGDQDLLEHTLSGAPLPVGQIQVRRHVRLSGEFNRLAVLEENQPLLVRAISDGGGAYFLATTPAPRDSSLARDGVVLYVLVQRAVADGAETLGNIRQLIAGFGDDVDTSGWQRLAGAEEALSTDFVLHAGIYQTETQLVAVNRPEAEDQARVLEDAALLKLFEGLDMRRVDDRAGSLTSLIQEVWRVFLLTMMLALVVEAGLSLPRRRPATAMGGAS